MVQFLLFTTNLPIAHTGISNTQNHLQYRFGLPFTHSPLAIASFVSEKKEQQQQTFILHFIKLEFFFPYKLNT